MATDPYSRDASPSWPSASGLQLSSPLLATPLSHRLPANTCPRKVLTSCSFQLAILSTRSLGRTCSGSFPKPQVLHASKFPLHSVATCMDNHSHLEVGRGVFGMLGHPRDDGMSASDLYPEPGLQSLPQYSDLFSQGQHRSFGRPIGPAAPYSCVLRDCRGIPSSFPLAHSEGPAPHHP